MREAWQYLAVPKARKGMAVAQIIVVIMLLTVVGIIKLTPLPYPRLSEEWNRYWELRRLWDVCAFGILVLASLYPVWRSVRTLSIRIDENGVSKLGRFGGRRSIAWSDVTSVSTRSRMAKLWFGEKVCICSHEVQICLREAEIRPVDRLLRFIEQHFPADTPAGVQRIERQDDRTAIGS